MRSIHINPRKLLLSKWTAVNPQDKEKHFVVIRLVKPELPEGLIEFVEMEAVYSRRAFVVAWRELRDSGRWQQGWLG
ncbi:MAG: TIGR02450 family Trp-rich protein [Methylococcaceae bacterium]|jgi:tryptophan-rich hypothetical protein|nr:TIGR02450 family Trp-rich protein [Methylococcaceae bacterium]